MDRTHRLPSSLHRLNQGCVSSTASILDGDPGELLTMPSGPALARCSTGKTAHHLVNADYRELLIPSLQAISEPNSCLLRLSRSCRKARARVVPIPPGEIPVAWATSA